MIRMYRWFIGSLMVLAIAFGIWYVVSNFDEQSSVQDGTLVWEEMTDCCEGMA